MSYHHQFTGKTQGIRPTAPVRWRQFGGFLCAYWEAEGSAGGRGYYLSANPRISVFFTDVSTILVADQDFAEWGTARPMPTALFVPSGVPMWTEFTSALSLSHLDIHLDPDQLVRFLTPAVGKASAVDYLHRPAEMQDALDLRKLAQLLVNEIKEPSRHGLFAESLAGSLVAGMLDPEPEPASDPGGRLTAAQMRKVIDRFEAGCARRQTVAEMAKAVNLSESWFAHVFKNTTGVTPLQWQLNRRIDRAQKLLVEGRLSLAEISARLGFSDQAHLTRAFRQVSGETPAAWRRARRGT